MKLVTPERTRWHSGLLLLLLLLLQQTLNVTGAKIVLLEGDSVLQQLQSGHVYRTNTVSDAATVSCKAARNAATTLILKFNGKEFDPGDSSESTRVLSSQGKLECFAKDGDVTSYAFVFLDQREAAETPRDNLVVQLENSEQVSEAPQGSDHEFRCLTEQSLPTESRRVTWFFNGQPIQAESGGEKYSTEASDEATQRLTVKNLSPSDAGSYGCYVDRRDDDTGGGAYEETTLLVKFGPVIVVAPRDQEVRAGQDFQLECKVSSHPPAKISWSLNDSMALDFPHRIVDNGRLIQMKDANLENTGKFTCSAENAVTSALASADVRLIYQTPRITSNFDQTVLILEGSSLQLDCQAVGEPKPQTFWLLNEETRVENPVRISNASILHDGTWVCIANSSFGTDTRPSKVRVARKTSSALTPEEALVHAHLNSNLSLQCQYQVDPLLAPSVRVTWFKDGRLLENEVDDSLHLGDVIFESGGKYSCEVTTRLDQTTRSWMVQVIQSPEIVPFPSVRHVLEGGNITVACSANGIPQPTISWLDVSSNILNLHNVRGDSTFTCRATNVHGSSERSIRIVAAKATSIAMPNRTVIAREAGSSITLNCSTIADLNLTPVKTWSRSGDDMRHFATDDGERLVLSYLRLEHGGIYTCRIRTEVDEMVLVQTINVITAAPKIEKFQGSIGALLGKSVELNCRAQGIPKPQMKWKFGSRTVTGETLIIKDLSSEDEGSYTCLAVNEYGSDKHVVSVNAYRPMQFLNIPIDSVKSTLESVNLKCEIKIDERLRERTKVRWFRDNEVELSLNQSFSVGADNSLTISNLHKSHEGTYTCRAENIYDLAEKSARITVLGDRPSFLSTEKDVRALEEANVTISCQANGLPLPEISWMKEGQKLTYGKRIRKQTLGDLFIQSLRLEDQGLYACIASNIYGSIETKTTVEVIKRAVQDQASLIREIVKNVRDEAVLPCDILYDPRVHEETKYSWRKDDKFIVPDGKRVFTSSTEKWLKIKNLTMEDKGVYECKVSNQFEQITSQVSLRVSGEAPKIISNLKQEMLHEGEGLTLKCLVRGVPRPTLQWFFNSEPLREEVIEELTTASDEFRESHVKIAKVSKANEGVYQCETSNTYGSGVAKFAKVIVIKRTLVDIVADGVHDISVQAGEKLKIPCNFYNDPLNRITNIEWFKNDERIKIGPKDRIDFGMDGSITITDVQKRHEGTYRCTVTTVMDVATDEVDLVVTVNAPVITSHSPNQVIFNGDNLVLICNANGIPEPEIHWTLNQTRTDVKNKEFHIATAIHSDAGNYTCIARNEYGETRKTMNVTVIGLPSIDTEYQVKPGSRLSVPCTPDTRYVSAIWKKNNKELSTLGHVRVASANGSLMLDNITSNEEGVYSCYVTSATGRSKVLQTTIKLTPSIIVAQGTDVVLTEGKRLALECNVLPGLEAKRLWKFQDKYVIQGGSKDIRHRGGLLTIDNIHVQDSGTYSCLAVTSFGQDTIKYNVQVLPSPKNIPSSCDPARAAAIETVQTVSNDTVKVTWSLPPVNISCFESIKIAWWTNESKSQFNEKVLSLSERSMLISGLDNSIGYFVQVNLVAPLNVQVYGETRSFMLRPEEVLASQADESGEDATAILILAVVVGIIVVLLILILVLYMRRKSVCLFSNAEKRQEHLNGASSRSKFNGISMYDGSEQVAAVHHDDFMQTLAPQWPEPEPSEAEECQLFIKRPHSAHFQQTGQHRQHRRGSRSSISSSWSSLFNVPNDGGDASVRSSVISSGHSGQQRNSFGRLRKE